MAAPSLPSTDTNRAASSSVTSVTATSTTSQGSKATTAGASVSTQPRLSKGIIALLAVIGAIIVGVFIGRFKFRASELSSSSLFLTIFGGFFVYGRVKKYRNRGKRDPSKPLASFSLSQSLAGTSSTQSGTMPGSRQMAASPLSHSAAGASPRAAAGGAKEDGGDRGARGPELHRAPETIWAPPPRQQLRLHSPPDQPREMSRIDEEPRFRFAAHPYQQNTARRDSSTSLPANSEIQPDELPLALPVSSHPGGIEPTLPSPPLSGKSLYSQSSYTHLKSDNGRPGTAASSSREPQLKAVEPKPAINTTNLAPPERKLSKSFLMFDDVETPSSSVQNLPGSQPSPAMLCLSPPLLYQTPATLYQSPALASSTGHTPNPNTRIDAKKGGKAASRFMIVDAPYTPLLSDELPLNIGDVVRLLHAFDDGWCIVERNGATGAVPKICLKEWTQT